MTALATTAPRYSQPTRIRLLHPWTKRQNEIAQLVAARERMSYAEIGKALGIKENTVRAQMAQMARSIHGIDAELPPRFAVWLYMRWPAVVEAIIAER